MKKIFVTAMVTLLALCLSSCSNGSSAVDCSSLQTTIGTATLMVSPSGDSSYTVQGTGMDGVAGIQLDISYDTASLANPTVTQGGLVAGAMLAANTSIPGLIRIAIISTRSFAGSGQIAKISFASKTGNGGITSLSSSMISDTGAQIPIQASYSSSVTVTPGIISTPAIPFSQATSATQSSPIPANQVVPAVTSTFSMSCR